MLICLRFFLTYSIPTLSSRLFLYHQFSKMFSIYNSVRQFQAYSVKVQKLSTAQSCDIHLNAIWIKISSLCCFSSALHKVIKSLSQSLTSMPRAYNRHQQALTFLHFICSAILISANRRVGLFHLYFFRIFSSFKLIFSTQQNIHSTSHQFHSLMQEGFSCLNAPLVFMGILLSVLCFSFFHLRGKIPLVLVLDAVDFHLAIKQPFAINFHTTTNDVYAKWRRKKNFSGLKWVVWLFANRI